MKVEKDTVLSSTSFVSDKNLDFRKIVKLNTSNDRVDLVNEGLPNLDI